jgi:hypothetical protein
LKIFDFEVIDHDVRYERTDSYVSQKINVKEPENGLILVTDDSFLCDERKHNYEKLKT